MLRALAVTFRFRSRVHTLWQSPEVNVLYETGRCSGAFKIQYDNKKCNRRRGIGPVDKVTHRSAPRKTCGLHTSSLRKTPGIALKAYRPPLSPELHHLPGCQSIKHFRRFFGPRKRSWDDIDTTMRSKIVTVKSDCCSIRIFKAFLWLKCLSEHI